MNEDLRDDLIEHEVQVRRAVGSEQRKVDARMKKLERDIVTLYLATEPHTPLQLKRFDDRVKQMAREAFTEQRDVFKKALRKVARAENDAVNGAIEELLND